MSYYCLGCGHPYESKREAKIAYFEGCPSCGSTDVSLPISEVYSTETEVIE